MRSGFTLAEVLVVMGITIVLTSLAMAYGRGSESRLALTTEQVNVAVAVNRAKSLTLGRMKMPDTPPGWDVCAFGVHFDPTTIPHRFIIFQDIEPEGSCSKASNQYTYGGSGGEANETVKIAELNSQVRFDFTEKKEFAFLPPFLEAVSPEDLPLEIGLITLDGKSEGKIIITEFGRVVLQ